MVVSMEWKIDSAGKLVLEEQALLDVLCNDITITYPVNLLAFGEGTLSHVMIDTLKDIINMRYTAMIAKASDIADEQLSREGFIEQRKKLNLLCHKLWLQYSQTNDNETIQLTGQPHIDIVIFDLHTCYTCFLTAVKEVVSKPTFRYNIDWWITKADANINHVFGEFVEAFNRVYDTKI